MYAEVIYETGSKSVMCVEDEAELLEGLKEQHRRATTGEAGGPIGHPAERVTKVLIYDRHPDDLNPDQTVSAEVVLEEIKAALKGQPSIQVHELAAAVRNLSSPVVPLTEEGRHESMYRMKEAKVLTSGWES